MTIPEIIDRLKEENIMPGELSRLKTYLAAAYGSLAWELKDILNEKDEAWPKFRDAETCTSDKQADSEWGRTKSGKRERDIRLDLKSIEKMMSSISTRIDVANHEVRGDY